jgi:hypothetical protein
MRVSILGLLAISAVLAATPDFTGDWKLNASKSDFGQFPAPSSLTQKVTHADSKMTVAAKMGSDQGEFEFTSNYTMDGKESTNTGFGGSESKSVAKLDGETLTIDTKGTFGDNAYTMKEKWTLSDGGKVLTIARHWSSSMGEADQKIVLDKQ